MKVNEFIEKYNDAKDKDQFLTECVKGDYVPYHEKMTDCDYIILATTKFDDKFRINSPMRFMLFVTTLLSRYTEIGEDEDILTMFETLDENNLIDLIISKIPEKEYTSYNTILNMELDDYMENNRSLSSILEGLGASLELMFKNNGDVSQNVSGVESIEE